MIGVGSILVQTSLIFTKHCVNTSGTGFSYPLDVTGKSKRNVERKVCLDYRVGIIKSQLCLVWLWS